MTKDAFERITQVSGAQENVFRAIDLLYKRGVNLGFKTCLLKENASQIKEIECFAGSLGAQYRLDDMLSRRLDGSQEPFKFRGKMSESKGKRSQRLNCYNGDRRASNGNLFRCGVGRSQAAINPFGELKMCVMIDYPRDRILPCTPQLRGPQNSLKDAWERLRELVALIKPESNYKYHHCSLKSYCNWCPANSWLYNQSFTSCEPESCKRAKLIKQRSNY
jgi:MoaA/NifB/PqqE/SkfB family radical SAM enzyme